MKLTLTMDMDGAAFHVESNDEDNGAPNRGPEGSRILRLVAGQVEAGYTSGFLRDVNGNAAGYWEIVL